MPIKKILYITKGEHSASTRYRATDFFEDWQKAGWAPAHVSHDGTLSQWLEILKKAKQADVVVVIRRIFRSPFRQLLRRVSNVLVFDYDDAIFVRGSGEISTSKMRRFEKNMPMYDLIWAGNSYLAEKASQFNSSVEIIPTSIDPKRYGTVFDKPNQTLDLVWIGSQSTRKHLMTVLPALEQAAGQIQHLRLKVISNFELESPHLKIINIPWSPETEARELCNAHIGIAPLPDNLFNRGKCGLKILQYMASRLPVIATPTGVNADLVTPGLTGYHAAGDADWVAAIKELDQHPERRDQMGQRGEEDCLKRYTLSAVFEQRLRAVQSLTHS